MITTMVIYFCVIKKNKKLYLDAIMKAGGSWADSVLNGMHIFIPKGFDLDTWEKENQKLIETAEVPPAHTWSAFAAQEKRR